MAEAEAALAAADARLAEASASLQDLAVERTEAQARRRVARTTWPSPSTRRSLAEEIEWYLLARLAAQRAVCLGGSLPLLLDDALGGLDEEQLGHVLGRLERMADAVQVIVVSDDPLAASWALLAGPGPGRRRAPAARLNPGSSRRGDHLTSPDPPRSGGAVAVITEAAIRELAGIRGDVAPITSCYLDVDGRRLTRHQDVEHELEGVLRERPAAAPTATGRCTTTSGASRRS